MAKLNKLKALYNRIAPAMDNVHEGIVKHGDDAMKILSNGPDDLGFSKLGDGLGFSNVKIDPRALPNLKSQTLTGPLGNDITLFDNLTQTVGIDGKRYTYPYKHSPQDALKERLLDKRTGLGKPDASDFITEGTVLGHRFPVDELVPKYGLDAYRPHSNTALGRWYADVMQKMGLDPFDDDDSLPF